MRCAWHRKYHGYPWIYEWSREQRRRLVFSDGMCRPCARRWRSELEAGRLNLRMPVAPEPSPSPLVPAWLPRVGVALALTTAVVLAARPLDPPTNGRAVAASARPTAVASVPVRPLAAACGHDLPREPLRHQPPVPVRAAVPAERLARPRPTTEVVSTRPCAPLFAPVLAAARPAIVAISARPGRATWVPGAVEAP